MRILSGEEVRRWLPMAACIEAMAPAMLASTKGTVLTPPRLITPLIDEAGLFGLMPGSCREPRMYGAKIINIHPGNSKKGLPVIQGGVLMFDLDTGVPTALIDAAEITAIRTAAASGLATRELARAEARTLGIFGTGVQAASHLEAMLAVRPVAEVVVQGLTPADAEAFCETRSARHPGVAIRPAASPEEAGGCDLVCTVTSSPTPVLEGAWVRPGAHLNLVGAHSPTTREVDAAVMKMAALYVDSRESAFNEAGDMLIAISEGAIGEDHIVGEIGEVLAGEVPGRSSADQVTVYESLGVVAQDLFAARAVLARAEAEDAGTVVAF